MIEILLFFIGASLLLYTLLGGADYGAGILEMFPISAKYKELQKKTINHAMGPVWEANHIWLILIVVILFMGFPKIFITMMTSLHLPMVALLVGIVFRGCAFTFRHYDAIYDEQTQKIYTWIFGLSSFWTTMWLGIIFASLTRGHINTETLNAYEAYVRPWVGWFPLVTGFFVTCSFAFLASIYLIGETTDVELKKIFSRRAFILNLLTIFFGGLVFLTSYLEDGNFWKLFLENSYALTIMIFATLAFLLLWFVVKKRNPIWPRIVAAGQVTLILLGWFLIYAPNAILTTTGTMSFYEAAAPKATLLQLLIALIIGSLFIFPSLFFLLKVFKFKK